MTISRRGLLASAAGALTLGTAGTALAGGTFVPTARQDDLWFVNSRGVGCGRLDARHARCFQTHRRTPCSSWQPSHLENLWATSGDGMPTVVFVHGNRVDQHWANVNGMAFYNGLVRGNPPPFRFVIYSWPAEHIAGPLRDTRYKAQVANAECYKFGWAMSHVEPEARLGIVGFSYGARILTGSAHLMGGGNLHGQTLSSLPRATMRAVLWAGALNTDWIMPGHYHGRALQAFDRTIISYNPCDSALRFYRFIDPCTRSEALGYTGISPASLGSGGARVFQRNVSGLVGREHNSRTYAGLEAIMGDARRHLLWQTI